MSVEDGKNWTPDAKVIYREVDGKITAFDTDPYSYDIWEVPEVNRVKPEDVKPFETPIDPNDGITP